MMGLINNFFLNSVNSTAIKMMVPVAMAKPAALLCNSSPNKNPAVMPEKIKMRNNKKNRNDEPDY